MNDIVTAIVTVICSVVASSGFWALLLKRAEKKDYKSDMLKGLGHDRIMTLGMYYIQRGSISADEYENLYEYLYLPYKALGGNGSAERVMHEVQKLRIRSSDPKKDKYPDVIINH